MKLQYVVSNQTNPFWNVAVENYLLSRDVEDTVVMYLWKNRRTVVIGQNQNPFSECNVDALLADGGYVMRRTTGGGAVYHDDGNINFSFVAPPDLYSQQRHFDVIRLALQHYGLQAEVSGRNDLLCQGRKFSGNAFSKGRYMRLHHGTILIAGNMHDLERYLRVKPAKLQKHGVPSVRSRVVNLSELADVTSLNIVNPLIEAFASVYGQQPEQVSFDNLVETAEVRSLYEKYSSDDWLYGRWRHFTASQTAQFEWGGVELSLSVDEEKSIITDVVIATDALDVSLADKIRLLLTGASTKEPPADANGSIDEQVLNDVLSLIY